MTFTEARAAARGSTDEPARQLVATVDEIERTCRAMNKGTPGWLLQQKVLDLCADGATTVGGS